MTQSDPTGQDRWRLLLERERARAQRRAQRQTRAMVWTLAALAACTGALSGWVIALAIELPGPAVLGPVIALGAAAAAAVLRLLQIEREYATRLDSIADLDRALTGSPYDGPRTQRALAATADRFISAEHRRARRSLRGRLGRRSHR